VNQQLTKSAKRRVKKLYYGKYTLSTRSFAQRNDIDGIEYIENLKRFQINTSRNKDIKFIIRLDKDKKWVILYTYYNP
jgi:hypothetical protein